MDEILLPGEATGLEQVSIKHSTRIIASCLENEEMLVSDQ
jgi:hypothetical protein